MSTRVEGATVQVKVTAHATLSAGPVHLSLSAREGPAPGTWRYNLNDGTDNRAATGRVAGMTDHMAVLRTPPASARPGTSHGQPKEACSSNSPLAASGDMTRPV